MVNLKVGLFSISCVLSLALVVPVAIAGLGASGSPEAAPVSLNRELALADAAYAKSRWAVAASHYRRVHSEKSAPARDDEILFRIGRCSENALPEFTALVNPSRFNPAHYNDTDKFRDFAKWVRSQHGYYIQFSEGDSIWRYDGGAYRELLATCPKTRYADDAAFFLVRIDFLRANDPAIFFAERKRAEAAARHIIAAYEQILVRYPRTNRKKECRALMSRWQAFLKGSKPPSDWLWMQE